MNDSVKTLPQVCREHGLSIDTARVAIRATPELRALGSYVGGSRVYRPQEVTRLVEVLRERRARRAKVAVTTT